MSCLSSAWRDEGHLSCLNRLRTECVTLGKERKKTVYAALCVRLYLQCQDMGCMRGCLSVQVTRSVWEQMADKLLRDICSLWVTPSEHSMDNASHLLQRPVSACSSPPSSSPHRSTEPLSVTVFRSTMCFLHVWINNYVWDHIASKLSSDSVLTTSHCHQVQLWTLLFLVHWAVSVRSNGVNVEVKHTWMSSSVN